MKRNKQGRRKEGRKEGVEEGRRDGRQGKETSVYKGTTMCLALVKCFSVYLPHLILHWPYTACLILNKENEAQSG